MIDTIQQNFIANRIITWLEANPGWHNVDSVMRWWNAFGQAPAVRETITYLAHREIVEMFGNQIKLKRS